jgi:hypothetical protein
VARGQSLTVRTSLLIAGAAALMAAHSGAPSNTCSHATAVRVGTQLHWGTSARHRRSPIGQVLCGPLAGPGSRAMVATLGGGRCGTAQWAVFRHNGATPAKQGADISEQIDFPRPGEGCLATRWRIRTWHWDGSRFTGSPVQVVPDGPNPAGFLSPDRKIWCALGPGEAFCGSWTPDETAELFQSGRLTTCTTAPCLQNFDENARVLESGRQTVIFGYRCTAEPQAITCVLAGSGKGFRIAPEGITPV